MDQEQLATSQAKLSEEENSRKVLEATTLLQNRGPLDFPTGRPKSRQLTKTARSLRRKLLLWRPSKIIYKYKYEFPHSYEQMKAAMRVA